MRAFPVSLPGQRYWTVLDEDLQVVGIADEYLRHQRFGRDGAESTTKAYAHAIGVDVAVPPRGMLPVRTRRSLTPYIYSQQDLNMLLDACPRVFTLELVTATMRTVIGLVVRRFSGGVVLVAGSRL